MAGIFTPPWPPQMPGRGYLHLVAITASLPPPQLVSTFKLFLPLSPTSRPVEEDESSRGSFRHLGPTLAPPQSLGFWSGTRGGWRRGTRRSHGYAGSGHYATAQRTRVLPSSRQPGAHYRLVKSWPNSISLFTSLRLSKPWHRGRG